MRKFNRYESRRTYRIRILAADTCNVAALWLLLAPVVYGLSATLGITTPDPVLVVQFIAAGVFGVFARFAAVLIDPRV